MKKFKHSRISNPAPDGVRQKSRLYKVFLGSDQTFYFKSFKAARAFCAEYSRDVNQSIVMYNTLLGALYQGWRTNWFYFHDGPKEKNYRDQEAAITSKIKHAEQWLDRAIFNTSGTYTGGVVGHHLEEIADALAEGFTILSKFLYDRRLYAQSHQLDIYARQAREEYARLMDKYTPG